MRFLHCASLIRCLSPAAEKFVLIRGGGNVLDFEIADAPVTNADYAALLPPRLLRPPWARPQNKILPASWSCRMFVRVPVICPNPPDEMFVFGLPQFGWFGKLNHSNRN